MKTKDLPVAKIDSLKGSNLKLVTSELQRMLGICVGRRPGFAALMIPTRPPGPEIGTAMNFVFAYRRFLVSFCHSFRKAQFELT
jgi:hypothetical protein